MNSRSIDIPTSDGNSFSGYLSLPPTGSGPGILLVQEIFGVNRHIRAVADQYAMDGYVVLAPDVFWRVERNIELGYAESDMQRGIALKQQTNMGQAVQDLQCAINALRALPECSGRVASLGFCMGGLLSYLCAATTDVDAAVCYYPGGVETVLDRADKIKCPIVFHFGEQDPIIPAPAVDAVKGAFDGRKTAAIEVHRQVGHGFNCWERSAYNQKAAALAHGLSLSFLATAL